MITPGRYPSGWESGCGPADPSLSKISTTAYAGTGYGVLGTGEVGTINPGANIPVTQPAVPVQVRAFKGTDGNLYFLDNDNNAFVATAGGALKPVPGVYSPTK
jgi:hypothetical protein